MTLYFKKNNILSLHLTKILEQLLSYLFYFFNVGTHVLLKFNNAHISYYHFTK